MRLAFENLPKEQVIAAIRAQADARRIVQGCYWDAGCGYGCAVGTTIHPFRPGREEDHTQYEALFGIPESIAWLEDAVHEGLPGSEATVWPLRFLRAVPEGTDLTGTAPSVLSSIVSRWKDALVDLPIPMSLRRRAHQSLENAQDLLQRCQNGGDTGGPGLKGAIADFDATSPFALEVARSARRSVWPSGVTQSAVEAASAAALASVDPSQAGRVPLWSAQAARTASPTGDPELAAEREYRWIGELLLDQLTKAPIGA